MRAVIPGRAALIVVLLAGAGCATLDQPLRGNLESGPPAVRECAGWFGTLDEVVDRAGVRDAAAYRIPGFPYLRVDRFTASFRSEVADREEAYAAWVRRLRALDAAARQAEVRNLPAAAIQALAAGDVEQTLAKTARCAEALEHRDLASPAARELLVTRSRVPDDYTDWQRALGLYPLTQLPFSAGIERWHQEVVTMFRASRAGTAPARRVTRYAPPSAAPRLTRERVAALLARQAGNPLRIPDFTREERDALFATYAPVFEVETTGEYDRIGALEWRDEASPAVNTGKPVVYRRLAHARYGEKTLVQLVYTVWFSGRPSDGAFDLLAGHLDGVILRVTLAPDGAPFVYDSIHPCGCFHMFLPTPRAEIKPAPDSGIEWAFVPATVAETAPDTRIAVRIATRTHYLRNVSPDAGGAAVPYVFADADSLRSLPAPGGARRSVFGPDGLIAGTERGERFFFWPMGIESAGAMRQWGRRATAFVGRQHFDDADLIERRFSLLPPPATRQE